MIHVASKHRGIKDHDVVMKIDDVTLNSNKVIILIANDAKFA